MAIKSYNNASSGGNIIEPSYDNFSRITFSTTSSPIVTSGLVLYLDAGNTASYPGSGSTWTDLSGSGNNMTLTGGPTFSSSNGGVLQFNGSNQYGSLSGLDYSTSTFTIMAASRYSGATRGRVITSITNNWLFGHWNSGSQEYYAEGWIYEGTANDTNWRIYTATENHAGDQRTFYVNNSAIVTNSTAGSAGFNGLSVGRWGYNDTEYSTCEVSFILVYNRILTQSELTQNFNALSSRFNIYTYTGLALNNADGVRGAANATSISASNSGAQSNVGGTATFDVGIPYTTLRVIYGNMSNNGLGNKDTGAVLSINGSPVTATGVYGSDGYNSSYNKYYDATNGTLNSIGIGPGVSGSHETGISAIIINGTKLYAAGPTWS